MIERRLAPFAPIILHYRDDFIINTKRQHTHFKLFDLIINQIRSYNLISMAISLQKTNIYKTKQKAERYFQYFKDGNELGFNYFYNAYYSYYAFRAFRFVKEELVAHSIAQDAFLRLWVFRNSINDVDHLHAFVKTQMTEAGKNYYGNTTLRFHRAMLRIDSIEGADDFLLGYAEEVADDNEDTTYLAKLEKEKKERIDKLNSFLPNLNENQKLFLRLCLKYDFNYERVSHYIGGISSYEVANRFEKCLELLKGALTDTNKLNDSAVYKRSKKIVTEGELSEEQASILNLRYELQYSFDEIAKQLKLKDEKVRELFIQAHAVIKKRKQTA